MVVVADAGMLSAANLNAIEDAGFSLHRRLADQQGPLRPGRRTSNATATTSPTGRSSNHRGSWAPGRPPGAGGWSTSTRSPGISATTGRSTPWSTAPRRSPPGNAPLKKDRFVRHRRHRHRAWTGTWSTGPVNSPGSRATSPTCQHRHMDGAAVVAAYHDLWQVEKSFRMAKSDLRARPVFHHKRRVDRGPPDRRVRRPGGQPRLQQRSGVTIKKILQTLRPLRSATVTIGAQQVTAQPRIPAQTRTLLNDLGWSGH